MIPIEFKKKRISKLETIAVVAIAVSCVREQGTRWRTIVAESGVEIE